MGISTTHLLKNKANTFLIFSQSNRKLYVLTLNMIQSYEKRFACGESTQLY